MTKATKATKATKMTKFELATLIVSLIAIIVSSLSFNHERTKDINEIKKSAHTILLEIVRIEDISNKKGIDAPNIITNLNNNNVEKIPVYDLNGDFILLSEEDWLNCLSVIMNEITPEEYFFLQSYHKAFQRVDEQYPIKNFSDNVKEKKDDLLKWWKFTSNIIDIYTTEPIKDQRNSIKEKLNNIKN